MSKHKIITGIDGNYILYIPKWRTDRYYLFDSPRKFALRPDIVIEADAKKYETSEIYLLYQRNNEIGNRYDISFTSKDGVNVYVYFIDVADIW